MAHLLPMTGLKQTAKFGGDAEKDETPGQIRQLGVSNVSLGHLERMKTIGLELPAFVQNRCFAHLGWDRDIRSFCRANQITYQGFSLLTANQEVANHHSCN